jgi:hypothetical protein
LHTLQRPKLAQLRASTVGRVDQSRALAGADTALLPHLAEIRAAVADR